MVALAPSATVGKRQKRDTSRRTGAALEAGGSVVAGTGLLAGGVPFAPEPNALKVWHLRGGSGRARAKLSNIGHNAKVLAPQPRAGILGFRANMHDAYIEDAKTKAPGDAYVQGVRGGKLEAEHKIVRGMRLGRKASYPITLGGAAMIVAGHRKAQVNKRTSRAENASAAALSGGAGVATVGHFVPLGLKRFSNQYEHSAKEHVLAAEKLAPHYGGLKVQPAKYGPFANLVKPERTTMYPARSDNELREQNAAARIKGGDKVKAEVGRHRGTAAQERHFVEVFNSTGKGIRRARNPGLALAGAGATGLWASREARRRVNKADRVYGYSERKRSVFRTAELGVGSAALAWGGSRLGLAATFGRGRRLEESVRRVTGHGEAMLRDRVPGFGTRFEKIPENLRPHATAAVGGYLAYRAIPTTHERFVPMGGR
jgi:hypothetical protein